MRILIDINHPADVHQFRNMIKILEKRGHIILVTSRDKDVAYKLLKAFKIPFVKRKGYKGIIGKTIGLIGIDHFLYKTAKNFKPDLLIGSSGNCYIAQISKIIGKPSIIFSDTEFARFQNLITFPFADKICTPSCFYLHLGKKQVKYNGYKELAYLYPGYFKPDPKILNKLKLKINDKFCLLRLVSFQASHDVGYRGISKVKDAIQKLEKYSKLFITSEKRLDPELNKYTVDISPEDIHSLLHYAAITLGESSTMAAESAVLGTPAIFFSDSDRGYTNELADKFGLVFKYRTNEIDLGMEKAIQLLKNKNLKIEFDQKRQKMLHDKIDVTKWMVDFVDKKGLGETS